MIKINRVLILGMVILSMSGCSKKQVAKAAIVYPETSSETDIESDISFASIVFFKLGKCAKYSCETKCGCGTADCYCNQVV